MQSDSHHLNVILRALVFAAGKHCFQRRKDRETSPDINHPIVPVSILCNESGIADVEVLWAAVPHDTVEDTGTALEELERVFGPTIRKLVEEVGDDKSLPKDPRKQLQIEHAARLSVKAGYVKLVDKICNLRDMAYGPPSDWNVERRQESFDRAKPVVDQICGTNDVLERLSDDALAARPG